MTRTATFQSSLIIGSLFIIAVGIGMTLTLNRIAPHQVVLLPHGITPSATIAPQAKTSLSPDGKKTLTMKVIAHGTGSSIYSFYIGATATQAGLLILTHTPSATASGMSIPFNAWSPGNKYVLVREGEGVGAHTLVLKTSGEVFSEGSRYLDVETLFRQKHGNFESVDVTGWAAPTLLVLNTRLDSTTAGPSFWFDVTNRAFTQLSTRF